MAETRRLFAVLTLLALAPVAAYLVDEAAAVVVLAVVNVFLLAWTVYRLFGPESEDAGPQRSRT